MIPTEIEFLKKNKIFIIKFDQNENHFVFNLKLISSRFSLSGEEIIEKEISIIENDYLRIGELIDSLKYSDVLHPVSKDNQISPFGIDNKHIIHIKWIGWEQKDFLHKYPEFKKLEKPEMLEIARELSILSQRINDFLSKINKNQISVENFYRTSINIIINTLNSVFPENIYTLRALLPTPFRLIQIKSFSDNQGIKFKLTPSETRKFVRFLNYFLKFL